MPYRELHRVWMINKRCTNEVISAQTYAELVFAYVVVHVFPSVQVINRNVGINLQSWRIYMTSQLSLWHCLNRIPLVE